MPTPAFHQLIALNTNRPERTTAMTSEIVSIHYRMNELQQVATDLRNERTLARSSDRRPNRLRLAIGGALVDLGSALAASPRRTSSQAR